MNQQVYFQSLRDSSKRVERRAVIDVGSNAVKLLVADVGGSLRAVPKLRLQSGLGRGSFRTGCLRPEAVARTVDTVREFASKAVELGSASIRVLATSATREATNGHELAQAVNSATGLSVEVISGEQEADYVFEGVTSGSVIGLEPALIVKVGGGSTEWVVGESGLICFRKSTAHWLPPPARVPTTRRSAVPRCSGPPPRDRERIPAV